MSKAVINLFDTTRKDTENELQYLWRLGQAKDSGLLDLDWNGIADLMNKYFGDPDKPYSEAAWRKPYQMAKKFLENGVFNNLNEDEYFKELQLQKQEIQKEKRKLYDERLDINRRLREESRLETTIEKFEDMLSSVSNNRYIAYSPTISESKNDMIVCLSDLHIGATYYGFDGAYDSLIAKERLERYLEEIINIQKTHNAENCICLLLGDLISGSIHKTISVTNKENVIEQVKLACEYISDFVYELGKHFKTVELRGVSGNHSRIEEKEDALLGERLDTLILWFIKSMLKNVKNISVIDEEIDDTLSTFFVRDKLYFGVHGDFDSTSDTSISKLILWAKMTPYCVVCGHKHYPAMTDVSGIKVVQSGSLGGSGDEYTRQKRLTGKPSQTVLVVNDKGIKCCYPIELG